MWYTQDNAEIHIEFQLGNLKERYYSEDLGTDGMIIVNGQVAGSCQHGNEPSGSTECKDFLE
jgi:hypothetical protein